MSACGLCETALHGDDATRHLCDGCETATAGRLAALPLLYADLAGHLRPGSPAPGPRSFRSGPTGSSLPVSEPVLGIRGPGGMVALLESWREALHDDRGWSAPRPHGSIEDRVKRAAKALRDSVPWAAAAWPAAGAFAEEIRDLHRDVLSIVAPSDPRERGIRLGNCPATVDGVLCGAALRAYPDEPHVTCRWCGCSWGPGEWLDLRGWLDLDEKGAA